MSSVKTLAGKVCVVTGATRGIGRGIALQLGEAGAKVYITGRTLHAKDNKEVGGSLEETAAEIERRGGEAIPVQCDHSRDEEVRRLFQRVASEQGGQLDVLVNNAYAAVNAIMRNYGKPFWEQEEDLWDTVNNVGLRNHYICSVEAAKLMVPRKQGLIVNVSSMGGLTYLFNIPYGVGKAACDRMAADCGLELRPHSVACVSLWPGAVRTENIMHIMDQDIMKDEASSRKMKRIFENGESTEFAGRCVVALANDRKIMAKSGCVVTTGDLADEYNLKDIDGKPVMNMRRVKTLLAMSRHTWLAALTPGFLKVPQWMVALMGNRFSPPRSLEDSA